MRLRKVLIPTCVAVLLVIVILAPVRPYADAVQLSGDFYDFYWGSPPTLPPNTKLVGKEKLSKDDSLAPGDYWEAVYRVKVHVHYCFGDDPSQKVKAILTQYLQNILGQLKYKYPYIYLFYAEFKDVGSEDDPNDPYGWWEIYEVHIIGKVMNPPTTTEAGETKLAWWVGVAVILALFLGCLVVGKMIIDDPNHIQIMKWIIQAAKSAISAASSAASKIIAETGPVLWIMVVGIGLLLIAMAITLIMANFRRATQATGVTTG